MTPGRRFAAAICVALIASAIATHADAARKKFAYKRQPQSQAACGKFGWPMNREREWFAQDGKPQIESGARRPGIPERAFVLSLESDSDASYVMPPERKSHSVNGYGGAVSFEKLPRPGLYQISLSDDGLVDVIQDGHYLKKKASMMRRDCPGIRRSLRVDLADGPLVLQFGGVEMPSLTVSVAPAE